MINFIKEKLQKARDILEELMENESFLSETQVIVERSVDALRRGKKIIFAGNGGSAADSQHLAAELVSRFNFDRPALPGLALTVDTSALTAIGNDYGYKHVFSRQIAALGNKGDLFFAISTSGTSENIIEALKEARQRELITIGFTGALGGGMKSLCDHILCVPSQETPKIQECHIMIGHLICECIEKQLFFNFKNEAA